jgi:hypothetical protein
MNSKHVILIALAVIAMMAIGVPLASAEWMNGVWYPSDVYANMISGDTVVHNPVTGVDSKYDARVGSLYDLSQNPNTYSGRVIFIIRSGMATLNPTLTLVNDAMPNVTKNYDVPDNANLEIDGLPAGNFTATLDNYNVPDETAHFVIATSQQDPTRVAFIGQAASQAPVHVPVITILRATYGMTTEQCTQIPAVTHIVHHPAVAAYYTVVQAQHGHGNQNYWFSTHGDDQYTYHPSVSAWGETVIDVPAHTDCVTLGNYIDVKANVQAALSTGHTSFLFNNAQNPGGIFDITTTNLLSQITDPAPEQVKNVVITYNVDGGTSKTITSREYQVISIT